MSSISTSLGVIIRIYLSVAASTPWKLAPLEIKKHENHFLKRRSELQRLSRDIEERLLQ
jgi:hypothetical protein